MKQLWKRNLPKNSSTRYVFQLLLSLLLKFLASRRHGTIIVNMFSRSGTEAIGSVLNLVKEMQKTLGNVAIQLYGKQESDSIKPSCH